MMSPNLFSFFSTVPVNLSKAKHRSVFTVSQAAFSQALGHLTPGLLPVEVVFYLMLVSLTGFTSMNNLMNRQPTVRKSSTCLLSKVHLD